MFLVAIVTGFGRTGVDDSTVTRFGEKDGIAPLDIAAHFNDVSRIILSNAVHSPDWKSGGRSNHWKTRERRRIYHVGRHRSSTSSKLWAWQVVEKQAAEISLPCAANGIGSYRQSCNWKNHRKSNLMARCALLHVSIYQVAKSRLINDTAVMDAFVVSALRKNAEN